MRDKFPPKPADPCSTCKFWSVVHSTNRAPYFVTRTGIGFCEPEGTPLLGVQFVAEASGEKEEEDGLPLRPWAQAGSIHTRTLRSLYVSRKQVLQYNILACRPPNNKLDKMPYESDVIAHCAPIRESRFDGFLKSARANPLVKEPVTVALGDIAFKVLTGQSGDYKSISYMRGYPVQTGAHGLVIGTFHPAYVRRNTKLMGVLSHDYRMAFDIARNGFHEHPRTYELSPNEDFVRDARARAMAMNPDQYIIFDYETEMIDDFAPRGVWPDLKSIQLSFGPGTGFFLDVNRDTLPVIKDILASRARKAGHNCWDFDVPLSEHWGIPINGEIDDTMWMFHHWQPDLVMEEAGDEADTDARFSTAASLQSVASYYGMDYPWKHLRSAVDQVDVRFYGVLDVDAVARIMMLGKPDGTLPQQLKDKGLWNGYDRYVRQFLPVLKKAAARGVPINRVKQRAFDTELAAIELNLDDRLQHVHPDEIKRLDPPTGFKKGPKEGEKIRRILTPKARALSAAMICPGGLGRGPEDYTERWEWFDEAEDVIEDSSIVKPEQRTEDEEPPTPIIAGTWRKMVQRNFVEPEVRERMNCDCLHDPGACESDCCLNKPTQKGTRSRKKGLAALGGLRPGLGCTICNGKGLKEVVRNNVEQTRWCRLLPFRTSSKQLLTYIKHKKHRVPWDRKLRRPTTNARAINTLAKQTGDPLYQTTLDIRTVSKIRGTYVTGRGWLDLGSDKKPIPWDLQPPRIHTTYNLGPATGQVGSRRPNVQNGPRHIRNQNLKKYDFPAKWRELIEARAGRRIWEFDLKSAHALTMGLNARDADYMRLARMDVHSYFASVLATKMGLWSRPIDLKLPDADLKMALKEFRAYVHPNGTNFEKDIRDTRAKVAILAIPFGQQGLALWEQNKEAFENEFDAQAVIDMVMETFPAIAEFKRYIQLLAHEQHNLVSRGGFIRWFHAVFDFTYEGEDEKPKQGHGDDAEDALAFLPANDAFVYMRDAELRLDELGINEEACFINTIHDSNKFEPEDVLDRPVIFYNPNGSVYANLGTSSKAEDLAVLIKSEMERLQHLLRDATVAPDGLWIGCDVKAGRDWAHAKEVKF